MNILEELFYGNIRPCDEKQSTEVRQKQVAVTASVDKLQASLPDESLRNKLDEVLNRQSELIALSERDAFINGFRLGIMIIVETLKP